MSSKKMVLRLRSRDGLERLEIDSHATVGQLRKAIEKELHVGVAEQTLSRDQRLLISKNPGDFRDMLDSNLSLSSLSISHGSVVYLSYTGERTIPGPAVTAAGSFGRRTTIDDLIARQTRVERQETPHCSSLSFETEAANMFQQHVHDSLAFSVKRCGFMYGEIGEGAAVCVHFIYEPPQQGTETDLLLMRDEEEEIRVNAIANSLGYRRVGFIFTHTVSQQAEDYTMTNSEVKLAASLHAEEDNEYFAIALVKLQVNETGGQDVHFEAFQLSDQCVKLWKEDWFVEPPPDADPKLSRMKSEVVVLGRDTLDVDNDLFLIPLKILDHQGVLTTTFPIENRIPPPSLKDLRAHLDRSKNMPYAQRLADFHVLLFLSTRLDYNTDIPILCEAVRKKGSVPDGYQIIIESLASHTSPMDQL